MGDPFEQKVPEVDLSKPRSEREAWEKVALWWRTIFPIGAFAIGGILLVYNAAFVHPPSNITYGVGLILAGLGPAGLIDVIKKIP